MGIVFDMISFAIGGFMAVVMCSEFDSWQRYRRRIGEGAFDTVYKKVMNIEQEYFWEGNLDASNECIKLENLLSSFRDEICNQDN